MGRVFTKIARRKSDARRAAKIVRARFLAIALFAITTTAKRPATPETASFAPKARDAGVGDPRGESKGRVLATTDRRNSGARRAAEIVRMRFNAVDLFA